MRGGFSKFIGITAGALALAQGMQLQHGTNPDWFIASDRPGSGHGWANCRRKLKKYRQDHQRPRRKRR